MLHTEFWGLIQCKYAYNQYMDSHYKNNKALRMYYRYNRKCYTYSSPMNSFIKLFGERLTLMVPILVRRYRLIESVPWSSTRENCAIENHMISVDKRMKRTYCKYSLFAPINLWVSQCNNHNSVRQTSFRNNLLLTVISHFGQCTETTFCHSPWAGSSNCW